MPLLVSSLVPSVLIPHQHVLMLLLMWWLGTGVVVALGAANYMFGTNPLGRTMELLGHFSRQEKKRNIKVGEWIDTYNDLHDDSKAGVDGRNSSYSTLVNAYYELATSFYEWGWGQSFHFAYHIKGENFPEAIARHEYYLAGRLNVSAGDNVLDCGCGIGGPMRNIARFTNARITGVTLSDVRSLVSPFVPFTDLSCAVPSAAWQ